jgi:succinylglutamate desuccinylase
MNFIEMNHLPDRFFSVHPTELNTIFDGPTLIHLDYDRSETIFISMMLHGNEHSGFYALKKYFELISEKSIIPKRNISILIGNVEAAAENLRFLDGQKDFNRIWFNGDSVEEKWAQKVYKAMQGRSLFACLDLHNNTGKNPHYCATTSLDVNTLRLASLFEGNILYFTDPKEVFSNYFSTLCPCLTIEAGQSGDIEGVDKIVRLINSVMALDSFDDSGSIATILEGKHVFESFGKIKLPKDSSVSFNAKSADFNFDPEIEKLNFSPVAAGAVFGQANNIEQHLLVFDSNNKSISSSYFKYVENKIIAIEDFYPAMITTNSKIVHQDCLCYLLKEIKPSNKNLSL